MATINFAGNTYAGEVLEDLLVYTAHGNDTFREGLIHIKPGIQKKFVLPHVSLGKIIQDNIATPTSTQGAAGSDGFNTYTHSERYLEPQDFMVYLEFNPRDFEEYWKPFQPDGQLIFRELDPKVQATMLHLLVDRKDEYLGDCIWSGRKYSTSNLPIASETGTDTEIGGASVAGPMKYFDGFLTRALDNYASTDANEVATGKVILVGGGRAAKITTGAGVESALYQMYQACPKNLRKSNDLKFVMGWDLWDLYDQYLTGKDVKYTENADVNKYRFKGKRIVVIDGIPEQTIALGKFTGDMNSCLWMGVDYATDQESVKVERLQANSELYFFQMRMKADVNIVRPSEIILWTNYKKATAAFAVADATKSIAASASADVAFSNKLGTVAVDSITGDAAGNITCTVDNTGNKVNIALDSSAVSTKTAVVKLKDAASSVQYATITVTVA